MGKRGDMSLGFSMSNATTVHRGIRHTGDCTFWYVNEYYRVSSARGWQTRIGGFHLPGCWQQAWLRGWSALRLRLGFPWSEGAVRRGGPWTFKRRCAPAPTT